SLWRSRNLLLFENRASTPETVQKAITEAREWLNAQPISCNKPSIPLIRFEPNPRSAGNFSIFTYAAWNPSTGDAGFGWILDDLVSTSQHAASMTSVSSPLLAETLAILTAIKFALSRGLDTISVLSDSQISINTLNRRS
ncbi:unnamed protein product, partial [Brassica rapa subsp. trilocularis]